MMRRVVEGRNRIRRKRKTSTGKIYVAIIMLFMVAFMTVQVVNLYQKNQTYKAREESLSKQLDKAKKTNDDLKKYEKYVGSDDYTVDEASGKLGLTYDNWIIFRQK